MGLVCGTPTRFMHAAATQMVQATTTGLKTVLLRTIPHNKDIYCQLYTCQNEKVTILKSLPSQKNFRRVLSLAESGFFFVLTSLVLYLLNGFMHLNQILTQNG